jgi:hypothetical protein
MYEVVAMLCISELQAKILEICKLPGFCVFEVYVPSCSKVRLRDNRRLDNVRNVRALTNALKLCKLREFAL